MEDVLKRLGMLETSVSDIKAQVSGLVATVPHLATKADISGAETRIVKWVVGTGIALAALAFTIAKTVH